MSYRATRVLAICALTTYHVAINIMEAHILPSDYNGAANEITSLAYQIHHEHFTPLFGSTVLA